MVEYSGFRVHTIRTYEAVIPMMEVCIVYKIVSI